MDKGRANTKVIVEITRQVVGKEFLQHVGGVGTNHQHFAVRHVDDAHEPEGNGEPQAHDQQDGRKTDTVEDIADAVANQQKILNGLDGFDDCGPYPGVGLVLAHVAQAAQRGFRARVAEVGNGLAPRFRIRGENSCNLFTASTRTRCAHAASCSVSVAFCKTAIRIRPACSPDAGQSSAARSGLRGKELDHVKGALHQRDVFFLQGNLFKTLLGENGLTGVVEQRGAGKVHKDTVVGEDEETFRPAIQGAFLEGLEQIPEGRVGEVADLLEGGALGGGRLRGPWA